MFTSRFDKSPIKQYLIAIAATLSVSAICYLIAPYIGHIAVALVLLFMVSILSVTVSLYPVLTSAILSALIWDFFFIPPPFTFHIGQTEDVLILAMYVTIALINGLLNTRIKHYEKIVRRREDRLKSLKLYNAIFSSVSHELRTPLTTIMGVTENLATSGNKIPVGDRDILYRELYIASSRLNRVVDNLMNMSRLESGHLEPKYDWCDLHELVWSAINRLSEEIRTHPLKVEFQPGLPIVRLDYGLMEQALFNIVQNICLHTPEKTPASITVSCRDQILLLEISDEGPGFSEEDKLRAFEKFYRAHSARSGGLGLGLSIARGFVQAHGGDIRIDNKKTGGALFTISVPVTVSNVTPDEQ